MRKTTTKKASAKKETLEEVVAAPEQEIAAEVATVQETAPSDPAPTAPEAKAKKPKTTRKKKTEEPEEAPVTNETQTPAPTNAPAPTPAPAPVFVKPSAVINNIVDLAQAPQRQIILSDQHIQQLTLEEAEERHLYLEQMLKNVLDYDVVISDTNIWLELLVGHTSSHSDPRVNARLQFERQMEFISKMTHRRKGIFMMMAETYEEIDRFATAQEPANYQDADFQDQSLCLNVAARLAKRLILSMQRENRLRIEGIGAESHHAAFADPAIIRRTVEFFAQGKKVLLITNDASVGIRSLGLCDDLQRYNNIDDERWDEVYVPVRPMVITFDDLKLLDQYTRQYHFIQQAAGKQWMEDITSPREKRDIPALRLWMEAFRPGDRHRTPMPQMSSNQPKPKQEQPKPKQEQPKPKQEQPKPKQEQPKPKQEQPKPKQEQPKPKQEQPKPQPKKVEEQPKPEENVPEVKVEAPVQEEVKAPEEAPKAAEEKPKPRRRGGSRRPKKPATAEPSNN